MSNIFPYFVRSLRTDCAKCGGRFHRGQFVVRHSDYKTDFHISCYAKLTKEGTERWLKSKQPLKRAKAA